MVATLKAVHAKNVAKAKIKKYRKARRAKKLGIKQPKRAARVLVSVLRQELDSSHSLRRLEADELHDRRERLSHLLAADRAVELLHRDIAVAADCAGHEVVHAGEAR